MTLAYLAHLKNLKAVADEISDDTEPTSWHLAALTGVCRRQVHRYIQDAPGVWRTTPVSHKNNGYRFARPGISRDALIRWLRKTR